MRFAFALLGVLTLLVGCKKPEPSFDERLAAGLEKNGIKVPAASGPTTPLPDDALLVFVSRDEISWMDLKTFANAKNPTSVALVSFDPARAATEGAPAKVRRGPADPIILPFADLVSSGNVRPEQGATILCSTDPPPAELMRQIRATLTHYKVPNHYRLVRKSDGSIANEPLPAP